MRDISPQSGGENEFVPKRFRNGASRFEKGFKVGFGGFLKTQGRLAAVASVGVTARQQRRFGNPYTIFVPAKLHF
jgi:hypothetical protein